MKYLSFILSLIAAVILLQTLFFKFTGAEESVWIFTTLGAEPMGRIGSGVVELVAAVLLLWPAWRWLGALLALGTMTGAILSHIVLLGIEVKGDGGTLFALAVVTWLCCAAIVYLSRKQIPWLNRLTA